MASVASSPMRKPRHSVAEDDHTLRRLASAHDGQLASAYAAGIADAKARNRRLIAVGVVLAVALVLRRRLHPLVAVAWVSLVTVALWPLVLVGIAVETAVRTHRRYRDWRRTGAVIGAWVLGTGACALAVMERSPWPLVGARSPAQWGSGRHAAPLHGRP